LFDSLLVEMNYLQVCYFAEMIGTPMMCDAETQLYLYVVNFVKKEKAAYYLDVLAIVIIRLKNIKNILFITCSRKPSLWV
jgi:hypothetical protein